MLRDSMERGMSLYKDYLYKPDYRLYADGQDWSWRKHLI